MSHVTRRAPRTGIQYRYASTLGAQSIVDEDSRTLELSFSSEARIPRWFGTEVLSHADGAVDLSRVASGDAPLLLNHDRDALIGIVESARIADGKGRATVRFAKTPEGQRALDLVNDRILRSVSVGYSVERYVLAPADDDDDEDADTFIAARWGVMELSLVAVPADTSVGVGRSLTTKDRRTMENDPSLENDPPPTRSQRAAAGVTSTPNATVWRRSAALPSSTGCWTVCRAGSPPAQRSTRSVTRSSRREAAAQFRCRPPKRVITQGFTWAAATRASA